MSRSSYSTPLVQLNLGKRIAAANTLHKELKVNQLCVLQEPVLRNNSISNVPKSHKQFVPFTKDRARVAALLPRDLARSTMVLAGYNSADSLVLMIKLNNDLTILLASIYMDSTKDIPAGLITRLSSYAEQERLPLIAGTDSNSHHVAWGHPTCDRRGRELLQSLNANNLVICNSGNTPTFVGKLGHSAIDLTIVNPLGLDILRDWKVSPGISLSDHQAITFNLAVDSKSSYATRSTAKCDWTLYQQLVESHLKRNPFWFQPVSSATELNARQNFISQALRSCFNDACPITRGSFKSSSPWWTAELTQTKQTTKALRRKANRTRNNADWELFRDANRLYTKLLKQAKRIGWKSYCDKIKGTGTLARINKLLNLGNSRNGSLNSLKKPTGDLTDSPLDTLQVLADTLIPTDGQPASQPEYIGGDTKLILKLLTPSRLDKAVLQLASNKAPGPDEIRNEMIQKAWKWIKDPVRMVFHHSLSLGITPESWHNSTGCVIPKPLKPDYTNPRAFRIISLTSSFQKLLERLILWYLEQDLNLPAKSTKNQHGFKKGKSTAIHIFSRRIEDAMATGSYSLGVFLDIKEAFVAVSFSALKEALLTAGILHTITQWIYYMVSNRHITLTYCDATITRKATKGSPQGGVLSPLLWNLTLDTFLSSLGFHSSFIQAFADDLVILIRGICKITVREIAQRHLNNIKSWCTSKGLRLSGVKSTAILFTNKQDRLLDRPLTVDGSNIPQVNSTVYLGVTLDSKLSWGPHIMKKSDSAVGNLQACKRAVGVTWGISPSGIKWIYNQVILPSVMYSAVVWHHSAEQKLYLKQRLETVQRHAALMITRGLKSSPTVNLEILAGLQPISLKLKEQAVKTALRLKRNGSWNSDYQFGQGGTSKSHAYSADTLLNKLHSNQCKLSDIIPQVLSLDRRFRINISDRETAKSFPITIDERTWQIYTDGSKQGKLAGAGFSVFRHTQEQYSRHYHLGSIATVYQCELFAIHMGCIWASKTITNTSNIVFLSDSQAAIKALNSPQVTSRLVLDTIDHLNDLGSQHHVTVRWVPGHENIHGNERADELAREGSSAIPIGPEPFLPLPGNYIIRELKSHLFKVHLATYKNSDISQKGKTPLTHYLLSNRYHTPKLSGTHTRWLTWLFTGHSPLNYFQYRSNNFPSPMCMHCPEEEETTEHYLCHCIGYMTIRLRTLGKPILTIEEVAKMKPDLIIKYVQLSGRFDKDDLFG